MDLVTGGAGFIGSHIAARLVADGRKVRIFDDFSTGKWSNLKPLAERVEVIEGDLRDRAALAKALRGCEFVYQQAALRSVPRSIDDPLANNEVNVTGILNLLGIGRAFLAVDDGDDADDLRALGAQRLRRLDRKTQDAWPWPRLP